MVTRTSFLSYAEYKKQKAEQKAEQQKKKAGTITEISMNSADRYAQSYQRTDMESDIAELSSDLRRYVDQGLQHALVTSPEALEDQKKLRSRLFYYKDNNDLKLSASYTLAAINPNSEIDVNKFINCLKPSTPEVWFSKAYTTGRKASQETGEKTLLEQETAAKISSHLKKGYYKSSHVSHVMGLLVAEQDVKGVAVDTEQMNQWAIEGVEGQLARASKQVRIASHKFAKTVSQVAHKLSIPERYLPDNDTFTKVLILFKDSFDPRNKLSGTGRQADNQLTQ